MAVKSAISIDGQTFRPTFSVIIPAHNRAATTRIHLPAQEK